MTKYVKPEKDLSFFRFNRQQYYQLAEVGILNENSNVELLDGQIIDMSPVGSDHAACVEIISDAFKARYKGIFTVRSQQPMQLSDFSEPEPDIGVFEYSTNRYAAAHPVAAQVKLLVEVAKSSLNYDQTIKVEHYAAAGIPIYWIVDLNKRQIIQFSGLNNQEYLQQRIYTEDMVIEDETLGSYNVSDLLPIDL